MTPGAASPTPDALSKSGAAGVKLLTRGALMRHGSCCSGGGRGGGSSRSRSFPTCSHAPQPVVNISVVRAALLKTGHVLFRSRPGTIEHDRYLCHYLPKAKTTHKGAG